MLCNSLAAGVIAFGLPTFASASLIFASSYNLDAADGFVSTIKYTDGKLEVINNQQGICGANPSWLEFVGDHIYCLDEIWNKKPNSDSVGALYALKATRDGTKLTESKRLEALGGPVSTVRFGQRLKGLAVAAYGGGGFQTFDISNPDAPQVVNSSSFTITPKPGAIAQQGVSHVHHVILDPTGDFIAAPDLGGDLIRIFKVDKKTLEYVESTTIPTPDFSGPRHGAFVKLESGTYFYVVTELSNEIIGWKVNYKADSLEFDQIFIAPTHGPDTKVNNTIVKAAELIISPDNKFLLVSSRLEESAGQIDIPNPETNAGQIKSDPLINWAIQADGTIKLQQIFPAGGINPRHFSLNKDGSLVLTALVTDGRVALIERNVQTGNLTKIVGAVKIIGGQPNFAKFKEDTKCA
ncbi:hypothetical protein SMACR_00848 [Sordaria macrospora]|uniref:WGS project CABT00000000 data, contig 2.2 n=2 Tax=Sordaria macrospora TaxID=5147 RepID=F7VN90_SORMK|nr:uncharacterized protein SMAC_00848 [Sordaria macrospora k-hell]KAA8636668.1 hypothetical protein SMACR_00848 [Sordaria macrospora]WPJ62088.1 hypothetical protein SMAC4_00848 [Sordaria macrospora]CCC06819.1 unnamed protein product [Sordaria macrospora k-hell]